MVDHNSQFYAILTHVGTAKQANADALGIPWTITEMGVGDAKGIDPTPDPAQPSLIGEWRRAPLNQLKVDDKNPSIIIAEQIIPADVGGHWIREIGLYDSDGDLIAVANCAPTYKPLLNQGSGRTQIVRMNLLVSSSSNVELKIDPSVVLATREYVDSRILAVLPPEKSEGTYTRVRVNERGIVEEGFNPTTLSEYGVKFASQNEAETGADTNKPMHALGVFQAIAAKVRQASDRIAGIAQIASQLIVNAGTDDRSIVTPKKLAALFPFRGFALYNNPGVYTWLVPSGVTKVWVEVIGGGGGGAHSTVAPGPSGGGGGGVARKLVDLTGVSSVTVTVGTGGIGAGVAESMGDNGGASAFGIYCSATGGLGGTLSGNISAGGSGVGGDENSSIGVGSVSVGTANNTTFLGGCGGGGESTYARADASVPTNAGQGGGGRADTAGAPGAAGQVSIRW